MQYYYLKSYYFFSQLNMLNLRICLLATGTPRRNMFPSTGYNMGLCVILQNKIPWHLGPSALLSQGSSHNGLSNTVCS